MRRRLLANSASRRSSGPGLIVAAAGIGSGDVVSATVGGATYGVTLLWAIALGAFFKFVLTEGIARWQLATNLTLLEGWAIYLPAWVKVYFGIYLVLWTVAVTAALTNATGLGMENLTGGAIPRSWGAVAHSFIGAAFVLVGGFAGFDKAIKVLVGIMGFSVLTCAALTFPAPVETLRGMVPIIPSGSAVYVLSLVGGIGGSITMLGYSYWMREEKIAGPGCLKFVRGDLSVAYIFTARVRDGDHAHRQPGLLRVGHPDLRRAGGVADGRHARLDPGAVRVLGVCGGVLGVRVRVAARRLAERAVPVRGLLRRRRKVPDAVRRELTQVTSVPYRLALLFVTLAPLPFAFIGRPIFIIVTYTVIGSLFIPFLAATLLYMNSRIPWKAAVPRNHWSTNALLVVILLLFVAVGAREVMLALPDVTRTLR